MKTRPECRLDALLQDNPVVQENRNEIWRKNDQAIILLATAIVILLSQWASLPQWLFLIVPFGFLVWVVFFLLTFWDAVVLSQYHTLMRREIDKELGKITLFAREDIEGKYWNPAITRQRLNASNPRYIAQLTTVTLLACFYSLFAIRGILWYWSVIQNLCLLLLLIMVYSLIIPTIFVILYKQFEHFVTSHIFPDDPYSRNDGSKSRID